MSDDIVLCDVQVVLNGDQWNALGTEHKFAIDFHSHTSNIRPGRVPPDQTVRFGFKACVGESWFEQHVGLKKLADLAKAAGVRFQANEPGAAQMVMRLLESIRVLTEITAILTEQFPDATMGDHPQKGE